MSASAPGLPRGRHESASPAVGASWTLVLLLVGAGIVSAFQVGKAPIALAQIQADLRLELSAASWLLSAFGIVGALIGMVIGLAVDHIGARRMAIGGLILQAAACAVGATSDAASLLLTTRVVEGIGFLAVIVAIPAMIVSSVRPQHLVPAMTMWATFMPVGITLIMFASPLLSSFGWRDFWLMNAAVLLGYAVLLTSVIKASPPATTKTAHTIKDDIRHTLAARGPWVLGGLFAAFCAAYFAVFGFLPSLLSERLSVSHDFSSVLSGVAIIASAAGNLLGGYVLARGVPHTTLVVGAFATMLVCGFGIFSEHLGGELAFALCLVFSVVSGTIPIVLFSAAPHYAPRPDLVGATVGMLMQGNNVGLVVGPAAAGFIASSLGWSRVSLLIAAISGAAFVLSWMLPPRAH